MQSGLKSKGRRRAGAIVVVSLMLGLWLQAMALAVSPELHRLLHTDSQSATHHCLITQLGKGSLLIGFAGAVSLAPPPVSARAVHFLECLHIPMSDYRLSPSRAPPFVSSSTTVVG